MAGHGYATGDRDPSRPVYTPSLDSDEELPQISNLSLADRNYRLFLFKKDGRSWVNASHRESLLPETEIKARARRPRKDKHSVDYQLDKMSPPRRNAIDDLVDEINRNDPHGDEWEVMAIDNENPEVTKRQGEVVTFSVILARGSHSRTAVTQDRRKSFASPQQEYPAPKRRNSKRYNRSPAQEPVIQERSPPERIILERSPRQREPRERETNQSFRRSQAIFVDDPFGSADLFSPDGKPVNPQGSAPYANGGLPPHIPLEEPIGAKPQNQQKEKTKKKTKKSTQDDGIVDVDALLSGAGDLLGAELLTHHSDVELDSPIEILESDTKRGRKRNDSGWGEKWTFTDKTPKQPNPQPKSKSQPRRPSIHIPKDREYRAQPIEVTPATATRRRPTSYYATTGSHQGSAAAASVYSDVSVLEAEYEDYSSSASSGYEQPIEYRSPQQTYKSPDGRYQRATRDHRRGPPSPQQVRYEPAPEPYTRRPRAERFVSDGAVQRYYNPVTTTSTRPPLVMHNSAPRFTPQTPIQTPLYPPESGMLIYPSELNQPQQPPMRRRDSIQAQEAQMYMHDERDRDREIELLQRERDVARREAELHQEIARRASTREGQKKSKYSYEPRSSRRYTDAYHG
ncbi:hypothetical protein H2198_008755 [Neophaeococcomyces mojaviensis]|uniref:Uncharacterized protein n=1 Tax=Neophaeococcomyces mojaviensis TaxID=3383035 RepID=A0ACC2ZWF1_9EURO|nr:hypothetical protein H2198_008755 [Knufia sp. JES_112]